MKKINLFKIFIVAVSAICLTTACTDKRHPGRIYMPDMAYSRALEAYDENHLRKEGINYKGYPVPGTVKRGDLFPYTIPNDSNGYKMSAEVKDPLLPLDSVGLLEAQRLYNINCGICHGPNLDAQGPLAVSGKVGGIANLKLAQYLKEPIGQMYHVVTYGKGNMGSYASQLDKKQRWMVVQFVKSEQAKTVSSKTGSSTADSSSAGAANTGSATVSGKDTTAKK